MKKVYWLYIISFLAAFLLFQIELIVSKMLLPQFGGSYLVWGACIVFFQCALLLGYFYSHVAVRAAGVFRYRAVHLVVVMLPLLFFPGRPLSLGEGHPCLPMVLDIFLRLLSSIGVVFVVLSTISIFSQTWLAASDLPEKDAPYRLYAVSNAGSFLGLLTYPFIFEYFLDVNTQLSFWRILYFIFVAVYIWTFYSIRVPSREDLPEGVARRILPAMLGCFSSGVSARETMRWLLLGAAGTVLFLSVTNIITYEIPPSPLSWIGPLAIYLVSFVLNFKARPFCPSWITGRIELILGASACLYCVVQPRALPFTLVLVAYFFLLFALCMFCQNALYLTRPKDKNGLTAFYLMISVGSFLGGMAVTWIAPLVFTTPVEFMMGLVMVSLAMGIDVQRKNLGIFRWGLIAAMVLLVVFFPLLFFPLDLSAMLIISGFVLAVFLNLRNQAHAVCLALSILFIVSPLIDSLRFLDATYSQTIRNYYGVYRLMERDGYRMILHGTTIHGLQLLNPHRELVPIGYYASRTPVGGFLKQFGSDLKAIGVVGLGSGELASYGRAGQTMDFYELDPAVHQMAKGPFTFLKGSQADVHVIYGDARINLERSGKVYDLLIVDAFSGDVVPAHLLTAEAVAIYKAHVSKGGVILFHVTNRYLDIVPVLFTGAVRQNAHALFNMNVSEGDAFYTRWVALTWDKTWRDQLVSRLGWQDERTGLKVKKIRPWTDAHSSILDLFTKDIWLSQFERDRRN